jgi:hypothetical protein
MSDQILAVGVECYAGHRGEQTPRTLILGDRRVAVAEVLDAWLALDYRCFKLRGEHGDGYLFRHDERVNDRRRAAQSCKWMTILCCPR